MLSVIKDSVRSKSAGEQNKKIHKTIHRKWTINCTLLDSVAAIRNMKNLGHRQ